MIPADAGNMIDKVRQRKRTYCQGGRTSVIAGQRVVQWFHIFALEGAGRPRASNGTKVAENQAFRHLQQGLSYLCNSPLADPQKRC